MIIKKGDKLGQLTVLKFVKRDDKNQFWLFLCQCGVKKMIRKGDVVRSRNNTVSCGCYRKKRLFIHGMGHTRINNIWSGMLTRVKNSKRKDYKYYGGKNIYVYNRWLKFNNFLEDMGESYIEHSSRYGVLNTTLDRINSNKIYSKNNCKWSTPKEQNSNKSNNIKFKGETATQASFRLTGGKNPWLVFSRLKRGWTQHRAFNQIKK